jgi:NitT/TauT family transport system substrate-binding protein
MKFKGYEPGESVAVNETYPALLAGQIDVAPAPITSYPALQIAATKAGEQAAYFALAPPGSALDSYNWGLIATKKTIDEDPDLVRKVVAATLQGWAEASKNPARAVPSMKLLDPNYDPAIIKGQLVLSLKMAKSSDVCTNGLGHSTAKAWVRTQNVAFKYLGASGSRPSVGGLYTNAFLPTPPFIPSTC